MIVIYTGWKTGLEHVNWREQNQKGFIIQGLQNKEKTSCPAQRILDFNYHMQSKYYWLHSNWSL